MKNSSFTLLNYTRATSQLFLSSIFINLLSLALPFTMLQIYDRILPNQSFGTATVLVIGVAIAILLELFLRYARSWLLASSSANFELKTTVNVVNKLLEADHSKLSKIGAGNIHNGLSGIGAMRELYSGQAAVALMDFPFVLIFLGLVAYIGGPLVFIPLLVWVAVLGFVVVIGKKLAIATSDLALSDGIRSKLLFKVLSGLTSTKALALEETYAGQYREVNYKRIAQQEQVDWLSSKLQEIIQGASQATTLLLVLIGCLSVLDGNLTTGGLAACSILAGRAVAPLSGIISLRSRLVSAKTSMEQVDNLLSLTPQTFTATKIYQQKIPLGPIKFESVNSQRIGASIKNLSFDLPPGKIMTLSSQPLTHASLVLASLAPFQAIDSGDITIDGIKVSDHEFNEYRQSVLYVLPWPKLFTGTLLENMTMFQAELEPQATDLAEQLGLTQMIAQLPSGYSTQLGEQNLHIFNKGAMKLIGLVRAIVQKPSILLLDEPMISLDADTQLRLTKLLTALKGEMTIIIASHFEELIKMSDMHVNIDSQDVNQSNVEGQQSGQKLRTSKVGGTAHG
jgi:ABC-type bacteriocin/lantibiotic exporter with double-glycine peptidase domain